MVTGRQGRGCTGVSPSSRMSWIADTWEWMSTGEAAIGHERAAEQGIDPNKEAAILGVWDARELDHCG